ncbi:hypothetical protein [Fodinibius sediminis]|uniref:Carbamoylphosphate synthase large subunit n=1 Tax=Fodinibius sediminis TaxID=1214077 RepID=A0A521B4C7_9BACT|nr:hypothetical protein [Fodinibius sediminis]SMO41939.1 Carbamoylphosphate synthase large subunit [Fodinibius sediminis]
MKFKDAKESILLVGTGERPINGNYNSAGGEIQCCEALMEEGKRPILMTSVGTEQVISTILNVTSYSSSFSQAAVDAILNKENIDAVFAPFIDSKGWEMVQKLEECGYWKQNNVRLINANLPTGYEYKRFQKLRIAISKANLQQPGCADILSVDEVPEILKSMGGLPVTLHTGRNERTTVAKLKDFNKKVKRHFEGDCSEKLYAEECPVDGKEVSIGILKDQGGTARVIWTSENVMPVFASSERLSISPVQTLNTDDRRFLYKAALKLVKELEDFAGFCRVKFILDSSKGNILVSDVSFNINRSALVSLSAGIPLYKVLTKLAMGSRLRELGLERGFEHKNTDRVLLSVPGNKNGTGDLCSSAGEQPKEEKIYIGHNFCEVLQKAWREGDARYGDGNTIITGRESINQCLQHPYWDELFHLYQALSIGVSVEDLQRATHIDSWFLVHIKLIVDLEWQLQQESVTTVAKLQWKNLRSCGFSDSRITSILSLKYPGITEKDISEQREEYQVDLPLISATFPQPARGKDPDKTIMVLASEHAGPQGVSSLIPTLLLINEARRLGYSIILVTDNTESSSLWMSFVDRIYLEPLKWGVIHEIYKREDPSGIFIDVDCSDQQKLNEHFTAIKAPVVQVPELTFPRNDGNGKNHQ